MVAEAIQIGKIGSILQFRLVVKNYIDGMSVFLYIALYALLMRCFNLRVD